MRILILFAFASLLFFSCEKEKSFVGAKNNNNNNNSNGSDTALEKFVKATGISDEQLKLNLDTLITRAKTHGWWDLCKVIYPFAGGTEASCKYNLKDPRDADDAFRLSFHGSTWTYTNIEANPGTSGYGDTHFNPSTGLTDPNNCHLSVYSMSDNPGGIDNSDIGAYDSTSKFGFALSTRTLFPDNSGKPFAFISTSGIQGNEQNGAGYFLMTRSGETANFYQNSFNGKSDSFPLGPLPNLSLFICNQNLSGNPYSNGFSQRALSFVTIGSAIDSATAVAMYSDIGNFVGRK